MNHISPTPHDAQAPQSAERPLGLLQTRYESMRAPNFLARGLTVRFNTPSLKHSRLRINESGNPECVLRNFSGNHAQAVVPWEALPAMVNLTMHDRVLHKSLSAVKPLDPRTFRQKTLQIDKSGAGGIATSQVAEREIAADQHREFVALRDITNLMKGTPRDADITPDKLQNFRQLAILIADLGVPGSEVPGPLRAILLDIDTLLIEIPRFVHASTDTASVAKVSLALDFISETAQVAAAIIHTIDMLLLRSLFRIVANRNDELGILARLSTRLSWLLDGWDGFLHTWTANSGDTDQSHHHAMAEMLDLIPLVPTSELRTVTPVARRA